jgi:hypothetical protein
MLTVAIRPGPRSTFHNQGASARPAMTNCRRACVFVVAVEAADQYKRRVAVSDGPTAAEPNRGSCRSRRKPLEQAVAIARKTRRRPARRRGDGGPHASYSDRSRSRVFPACGIRFSERMARGATHGRPAAFALALRRASPELGCNAPSVGGKARTCDLSDHGPPDEGGHYDWGTTVSR